VIRGKGAPFTKAIDGQIRNSFSIRLVNREDEPKNFQLEINKPSVSGEPVDGLILKVIDPEMLKLSPSQSVLVPVSVDFPASMTLGDGNEPVDVVVTDDQGQERRILVRLLGPR
jgi:hypothetical protein